MSSRYDTTARAERSPEFDPLVLVLPDHHGRIDPEWLKDLRQQIPGRFAAPEAPGLPDAVESIAGKGSPWPQWLGQLPLGRARDGVLVIMSGLRLPQHFENRLATLATAPDCPPLTVFAGNHEDALNPAAGLANLPAPAVIDSLAHAAGRNQWTAVDHAPERCVWIAPNRLEEAAALMAARRAWLYDGLWICDPDRGACAGALSQPDCRAALGGVRLVLQQLQPDPPDAPLPLFGLDDRPVILHISHDWGGGVARWIGDLIRADQDDAHLVLSAVGHTDGRVHGQRLRLYADGPGRAAVGEWVLTPAIAGTVASHEQYTATLQSVIERYGVGQVIVSSLIGHSLEALATGLPTLQVLHDYYPAWPVLDHDPLAFVDDAGHIDLGAAIDRHGDSFLFRDRDPASWQQLTERWREHIAEGTVRLTAPTRHVLARWQRLTGDELKGARIIPHGFEGWAEPRPELRPAPLPDGRLNLVIVGRLSPGKGLGLLEAALPRLRPLARITLLGCGHHGMRLFGQAGVDIVLDYDHAELPMHLSRLAPQGVLFLSTVPETWNYVLSETRTLGLVPLATRTGSFAERIQHDHDGILFDPDADGLIAAVAAMKADPEKFTKLRDHLPQEPTLAGELQAIGELLPMDARRVAPPHPAGDARLAARTDSADLADQRERVAQLEQRREQLTRDLAERAAWARKYERLSRERTAWAKSLESDLEDARQVVDERHRQIQSLDHELALANAHVERLDNELQIIFASRSWKITRPLRTINRVLANAARRRVYNPLRWPGLIARLFHNLRVYGLFGTLDLMQQAETQPPPQTATVLPEEPPEALEPVHFAAAENPRASIVVPAYNNVRYTAACLKSIAECTDAGTFEVIVVDDCSTDETREFLSDCSGLTVIRNQHNAGFIDSCNTGLQAARAGFVVLLNNDTTLTAGWLDALLDTFQQFPDCGAAGARLIYPDGSLQEAGGIIFSDGSGWNYGRGDRADRPEYNFACEADYVSGACLAVRREVFERLEGFDRRYVPAYYEDTDLCFRMRELGLQVIFQPACTVVHHEGVSSGTDEGSSIKRYQAVNREKFVERWRDALATQPAPVPGTEAIDEVRRARHFRSRGHILVIDAVTPEPDKDSGSMRMVALLEICRQFGYRVSFLPENLLWVDRYTPDLQRRGVQALYHPFVTNAGDWLKAHGHEFDMVIGSRHYVLAPLLQTIQRFCPNARLVFDTVDLHFLREQRKAELTGDETAARMASRTRAAELNLIRQADTTLVVSPVEQALLTEALPDADIRVLSNIHRVHGRTREWNERRDLVFVGGFQHPPNIDAAEWLIDDIMPLVQEHLPDVRLHLIGSRMPEHLRERRVPGVVVHGYIERLEPYLESCRLSLAPLRYGAGVKGKVNQAMSWGLPVIATTCAAEGMFLDDGEDVLTADTAEDFAAAIVRAYTDRDLWTRLSDGGLANVERYFSYDAARRAIRKLVDSTRT